MNQKFAMSRAVVAVALVMGASQAMAETKTVGASATVVTPITLTPVTPFNFGSIVPGATAGAVVLSTGSGRTASGGTILGNGTTPTAAVVQVDGSGTSTFSVSFSTGTTLSNGAATPSTMTVDAFVMKAGTGADQTSNYTGQLSNGTQNLTIGARLNVGTSTANPTGTYSTASAGGTPLSVTVEYN